MESHPSLEELMSRPARERREQPWNILSGVILIGSFAAYLLAWLYIPEWLVPWWLLVFIPLLVVDWLILRRLERWWWSHSPWAWRERY